MQRDSLGICEMYACGIERMVVFVTIQCYGYTNTLINTWSFHVIFIICYEACTHQVLDEL